MLAFPCPCCGHLTFGEPPGSFEICPVCFWEDDDVQLRWPELTGGANRPSLVEAQHTYVQLGAMESRFLGRVRLPNSDEPRETGWRLVDPSLDSFEPVLLRQDAPWPTDRTTLYWWRPSFWRRDSGSA